MNLLHEGCLLTVYTPRLHWLQMQGEKEMFYKREKKP